MAKKEADESAGDAEGGDTDDDGGSEDYSHLFRNEALVSDVDLKVDVADNYIRLVVGDEDIEVDVDTTIVAESMSISRGARTRRAGSYQRNTYWDETYAIGHRIEETVHGGVHQKARFAAEAIVGGAYTNTIAGPYLRLAGWVDFLAWGGWAEVDMIRAELTLLMARSHVNYSHAALVRATMASRLVDDFQTRTENFSLMSNATTTYTDTGAPGGGVTNNA